VVNFEIVLSYKEEGRSHIALSFDVCPHMRGTGTFF
jgi:hypothetical protein